MIPQLVHVRISHALTLLILPLLTPVLPTCPHVCILERLSLINKLLAIHTPDLLCWHANKLKEQMGNIVGLLLMVIV